jgi:two-component system sensor histidine kinase TctE
VQDWVQASFARKIDLGFEPRNDAACRFSATADAARTAVNLIDNALRYTPAGGSVTVRVRANELATGDAGSGRHRPGHRADRTRHVFERFYRILGTNVPGSGLGWAIVREIAQQHGAEVDIFNNPRSDPAKPGCLFRLTFPAAGAILRWHALMHTHAQSNMNDPTPAQMLRSARSTGAARAA